MATEDISRNATAPRKRYAGVRLQQGRVSTDDDYNEGARIAAEERRRTLLDVIGPSGSADQGFAVSNPRINGKGDLDFDIGAGTLYLDGTRLTCEGEIYTGQSDWLEQPATARAAPTNGRTDLVYLMTWDQPVEAVEDSELFETALGGPDTTTRVRPMRRVLTAPGITGVDCAAAWAAELTALTAVYGAFDPATGVCVPDATLKVTFDTTGKTDDLCAPSVIGGYLGAENQAIRVQIVDTTHLTWGFDNAAPLYRVTVGADLKTVTVQTEPKDQMHWMRTGQTVEILAWSAVLPNKEKLAELTGHLTTVDASYDPDLHTMTLKDALPAGFGRDWIARADHADLAGAGPYLFLRVWPRGDDASPAALSFTPGTPVTLGHTGVIVTLAGTQFVPSDYWVIAARPEDPTQVVPWDFQTTGRLPHGIRRAFTPLARIVWSVAGANTTGTTIDDCRVPFQPLTRRQTCCTYTVGDGTRSHGDFAVIQDAIDRLPASGGCICILPGIYDQDFRIDSRHDIRIEGCGRRTLIRGAAGSKNQAVATIADSQRITLVDLAITSLDRIPVQLADRDDIALMNLPPALSTIAAAPPNAVAGRLTHINLHDLTLEARDLCAIAIAGGRFIEVTRTGITIQPLTARVAGGVQDGPWPAIYSAADDVLLAHDTLDATGAAQTLLAARGAGLGKIDRTLMAPGGIQIAGGSERVTIRGNRIAGGTGNGITLGSVAYVPALVFETFNRNGDFLALTKQWTHIGASGWVVVIDNGCIRIVPDPPPPNDGGGVPMIPISAGPLTDIRIEDNEIADMGQSGIAVARFFDLDTNPQAIVIDGLTIEENHISHCLWVDLPEITGRLAGWAAYGAIALAVVNGLSITENTIETNGASHVDPICGVFVLAGSGIDLLDNTIRDNGPRTTTAAAAAPGLRGGLVLGFTFAPDENGATEARPAARVHDNIVVCQDGQALLIAAAIGAVSVQRNALTSRGATGVGGSAGGAMNSGTTLGHAKAQGLASAVLSYGACVVILDLGISSEFLPPSTFASQKYRYGISSLVDGPSLVALPRGTILFSGNQIQLETAGSNEQFFLASVLLFSLDDVAAENNQFELVTASLFLADLLVGAGSARVIGNRLSETLFGCYLSILSFGVISTVSINQSTHCVFNQSVLFPRGLVTAGNIVLIETLFGSDSTSLCPPQGEYHQLL